jgi:hypothetical protein
VDEHRLHLGDPRSERQGRPGVVEGLDGPGARAAREAQDERGIFGLDLPEGARTFAGAEDAVGAPVRQWAVTATETGLIGCIAILNLLPSWGSALEHLFVVS